MINILFVCGPGLLCILVPIILALFIKKRDPALFALVGVELTILYLGYLIGAAVGAWIL